MQGQAWISLLRRIPPEQQDTLVLVTTVGIELSIKNILRLEDDYVAIRGRLAGTTDAGRVFFVPYDQINYVGFLNEMKEAQFHVLFGGSDSGLQTRKKPEPL